jgi:hypothetical protein
MAEPTSTQERYPLRAAVRTAFQVVVALATLLPYILAELPVSGTWVAQTVAVAMGITRVMAMPQVNEFLNRFAPLLAAEPKKE